MDNQVEIRDYRQPDGTLWLPTTCWHSSRTGGPRALTEVQGTTLHKISGAIAFPEDPFNTRRIVEEIFKKYRVSYNLWIHPDGIVERLVPPGFQSFHAGKSRYIQQDYCNGFTLGVALISDGKDFPDAQVVACANLHRQLIEQHGFDSHFITTHSYVRNVWNGTYPDKKGDSRFGDPGKFPWARFREVLEPPRDLDGG